MRSAWIVGIMLAYVVLFTVLELLSLCLINHQKK
jgi:hypothetical protein